MKQLQTHPDIYQLRIVLRGISPLIWRRLLVRSDTTLAQLHRMLQILFEWSNEHLHRFHYVYNFYAQWQCDVRLEATLPVDPQQVCPVCIGGKRPAPPEHVQDAWTYLELLDEHRFPPFEAILTLADMAQSMLDAPAGVSIREAVGDLDEIREAMERLHTYEQVQPSALKRCHINAQLHQQTWTGDKAS